MSATPNFCLDLEEESMALAEPSAMKRSFATITEVGKTNLDTNRVSMATRQATDKWLRAVCDYVKEKKIACDLATIAESELAKLLRQLYVEIRQKDGSHYSKSSLLGCRAAVHRY